uniref:ShKT domain-containing protein n=1 Tax=Steinernema glaseri TaxID=37863 RepID=A0A1I8AWP6_9BILA
MRTMWSSAFTVLFLVTSSHALWTDDCPNKRESLGACLAGLCPVGAECVRNYCCKHKPEDVSTTSTPLSTIESSGIELPEEDESKETMTSEEDDDDRPKCENGERAIGGGKCLGDFCPKGFICENGHCCSADSTAPPSTPRSSRLTTTASPTTLETPEAPDTTPITEETESPESEELPEDVCLIDKPIGAAPTTLETTEAPETTPITEVTESPESEELPEDVCLVDKPIGECIEGQCPPGNECADGKWCCPVTPEINCTDVFKECKRHMCNKKGYEDFMTERCGRTCRRCHQQLKTTSGRPDVDNATKNKKNRKCKNSRTDCDEWASQGFCESALYSDSQKRAMCGISCKLC